jgi:hypothetical protein
LSTGIASAVGLLKKKRMLSLPVLKLPSLAVDHQEVARGLRWLDDDAAVHCTIRMFIAFMIHEHYISHKHTYFYKIKVPTLSRLRYNAACKRFM